VGFSIHGYELGLVPSEPPAHAPGNEGVTAYWGVANIDEAWKQIVTAGAKPLSLVQDVGGDVRVGSVTDPYGNVIGLIENPHFKPKG
jgi:predicted enzyme related to lactoylglutathione lyase